MYFGSFWIITSYLYSWINHFITTRSTPTHLYGTWVQDYISQKPELSQSAYIYTFAFSLSIFSLLWQPNIPPFFSWSAMVTFEIIKSRLRLERIIDTNLTTSQKEKKEVKKKKQKKKHKKQHHHWKNTRDSFTHWENIHLPLTWPGDPIRETDIHVSVCHYPI